MSKFIFKYIEDETKDEITFVVNEEVSTDVIRRFYEFLLGVSFNPELVLEGLQAAVSELENDKCRKKK